MGEGSLACLACLTCLAPCSFHPQWFECRVRSQPTASSARGISPAASTNLFFVPLHVRAVTSSRGIPRLAGAHASLSLPPSHTLSPCPHAGRRYQGCLTTPLAALAARLRGQVWGWRDGAHAVRLVARAMAASGIAPAPPGRGPRWACRAWRRSWPEAQSRVRAQWSSVAGSVARGCSCGLLQTTDSSHLAGTMYIECLHACMLAVVRASESLPPGAPKLCHPPASLCLLLVLRRYLRTGDGDVQILDWLDSPPPPRSRAAVLVSLRWRPSPCSH